MKASDKPKLLFFTAGAASTADEKTAMQTLAERFKVCPRNAGAVLGSSVENAQAVAGLVPEAYKKRFPSADDYVPSKEPPIGSVYKNVMGQTVERIRSARDGSPVERTLFSPPPPGSPRFNAPANSAPTMPTWKPNA